jgi:hypothetical protein
MEVPPKRNLYVIRWTVHGSEVDEWSDEIYDVETCGGEVEEAMSYITGDGRRGDDAMLLTDGICKDDGLFYKAFPTIEEARDMLVLCHAQRIKKMRNTIQSICGLDQDEYDELLDTEEIVEFTNEKGRFPSSANVVRLSSVEMTKWIARQDDAFVKGDTTSALYGLLGEGTFIDTSIGWGSTSYNDESCNNDKQHKYIRCVSIVHTHVTCWIEALELRDGGEDWLQEVKV